MKGRRDETKCKEADTFAVENCKWIDGAWRTSKDQFVCGPRESHNKCTFSSCIRSFTLSQTNDRTVCFFSPIYYNDVPIIEEEIRS